MENHKAADEMSSTNMQDLTERNPHNPDLVFQSLTVSTNYMQDQGSILSSECFQLCAEVLLSGSSYRSRKKFTILSALKVYLFLSILFTLFQ